MQPGRGLSQSEEPDGPELLGVMVSRILGVETPGQLRMRLFVASRTELGEAACDLYAREPHADPGRQEDRLRLGGELVCALPDVFPVHV